MGKFFRNINRAEIIKNNIALIVLLLLVIVSTVLSPSFMTPMNIFNLLRQLVPPTLLAMGMLFVILTGGIDLSVGSIVAMSAVLTAFFMKTNGLIVSILFVILIAAVVGAVSGYFVAKRRLAPFVVTLAAMSVAKGIAFMVSRGQPTRVENDFLLSFAISYLLGVPALVWFSLIVVVLLALVQRFTVYGRFIQAVGSNETAVTLSGINSGFYKISVYVISAVFAAIGGIVIVSRVGTGSPLAGDGAELDAIAAVVIGGASLSGGRGTVVNTFIGVLVLGLIGNIMNLLNVASYPQMVLKGAIIIAAVLLQSGGKGKDISSSNA